MLNVEKSFKWNGYELTESDFDVRSFIQPKSNLFMHRWGMLRLEVFYININENKKNSKYFNHFLEYMIMFTCVGQTRKERRLFYIYLKYALMMYKGIRHFLGLPVRGNRTWSNRKNPRKNADFIIFCQQMYFTRKFKNCNRSRKKIILYAELLNKIYYLFFRQDWLYARNRRESYIQKESYLEWKFDLRGLLANRVIIREERVEKKIKRNKKKKQRKKFRVKKNLFNLGFDFGFSKIIEKKMFRHFFVTRRSHIPKKKKKKKKK